MSALTGVFQKRKFCDWKKENSSLKLRQKGVVLLLLSLKMDKLRLFYIHSGGISLHAEHSMKNM